MSNKFRFSRVLRTPGSEEYVIWDGSTRVGHVHLHYVRMLVYMSVLLEVDLSEEDRNELIHMLDEDVISSYMPSFEREDLLVTIYQATELSIFSSSYNETDFDDED